MDSILLTSAAASCSLAEEVFVLLPQGLDSRESCSCEFTWTALSVC
jgi:hypothetical protein